MISLKNYVITWISWLKLIKIIMYKHLWTKGFLQGPQTTKNLDENQMNMQERKLTTL